MTFLTIRDGRHYAVSEDRSSGRHMSASRVFRQLEAKSFTSCWRVIKELRCVHVLDPIPTKRAASYLYLRSFRTVHFSAASIASGYYDRRMRPRTFSSFVVRRTMSYSCRRAASGSIRDARRAGA